MILVFNLIYSVYGWLSSENNQVAGLSEPEREQVMLSPEEPVTDAAEGLELAGLTGLVKEVRSGQELERILNEKDSINNMDLNGDNQVDYLFVREYGDPQKKIGYSITTEPEKGEVQEIADVTVELNGDRAEIQVVGNEQIYGRNAIYNDWTKVEREVPQEKRTEGAATVPMHASYFYPHPLWISPFFFGFYPGFFSPFPVISRQVYVNRVNNYNPGTVARGQNAYQRSSTNQITSPNQGKTANKGIARSLRNPTSTQKQFQATQARNLKAGGFGRTSRSAAGTSLGNNSASSSFGTSNKANVNRFGTSQKSTNRSTTGSLFGNTGKSFGSSSGSFRSRSFGSRSFSFGK